MSDTGGEATIDCELVADRVSQSRHLRLRLPQGATVADAVRAACETWGEAVPDSAQAPVGVWGVEVRPTQPLRSGDRVELYRALPNDPRAARRARAATRKGNR